MAASSGPDPDDMIAAINVTPLVDIMLVLLVVFMVTARLMTEDKSVPMDLPHAASATTEQTLWTIAVQRDGETRVNGELVQGRGALRDRARVALAKTPDLRAVIAASRHTEHGAVVGVLDELRQGGLTRVAFGASPEDLP